MRKVRFDLADRMAVAPVELAQAWPLLVGIVVASALFGLPFAAGYAARLLQFLLPLGGGVLVAVFAFPALLPYLPFRAFALKGAVLGVLWGIRGVHRHRLFAHRRRRPRAPRRTGRGVHRHELHRLLDVHQPARARPWRCDGDSSPWRHRRRRGSSSPCWRASSRCRESTG